MDTTHSLIRSLISDFQARQWKSEPMEKALRLASSFPEAISTFARAIMVELPKSGTFLDATLAFLPESDWPELVQTAVEHLRVDPRNEAAESVITQASLQCLPAVHPFLSELFLISDRFKTYYATNPWRESGTAQLDFLIRQLHGEAEETSEVAGDIEPECDGLRDRALLSLLETRVPEALRIACASAPALGYSSEHLRSLLAGVDCEQEGDGFRRLTPASVYHLQFQAGYVERPPYLNGTDFPTWETLAPEAYSYRFGGTLETTCGLCGSPLHHLLTLDPVLKGLGVTGLPKLSLATCLSCLGWEEEWLFFLHDADGLPTAFYREEAIRPPRFLSFPLEETRVAIVETPSRWRWQDWGLSNGTENLHRLGGHPCWVQSAQFPACPCCTRTMPFLMQLDSNLKTADNGCLLWGSGGIAYIFWCDACRLSATMWQCT